MRSERWHRLQSLFGDALARPLGSEREAFIVTATEGDAALASSLRALLAQDAIENDPVSGIVGLAAEQTLLDGDVRRAWIGRRLGAWRISAHLADGGMGAVYRAERADGQYEQQAAIKLINPAFVAGQAGARLAAERQILARLEHPHVARLLDGGTTDDGAPYLVMEYIDGTPIDAYCNQEGLDTTARLRLFQQICGAVDYAHRHLVVHRDLKSANILVDHDGQPKLLDFGIAKLVEASEATLTAADQRVLTLTHASPEQIRGEPITTATDVYALGVLLYELLTGRLPYAIDGKTPGHLTLLARQILETEPRAPSSAVADGDNERIEAARRRGEKLTPDRLKRELQGDLDNIVLMALRKEPERRYGSAQALNNDITRFLDDQTVSARPDTLAYQAGKFVHRHSLGVVATAATVLAVAALVGFYTWQLSLERDRARVAAARAERVAEFLAGVFSVADPTRNLGKTVTARELLDNGAQQIERELASEPEVQAALMEAMGSAYQNLGLYPEARDLHQRALDIRLATFGPDSLEGARSLTDLGVVKSQLGNYDEAIRHLQAALLILRRAASPDPLATARALRALGFAQHEAGTNYAQVERTYLEAIDAARDAGKAGDAERARAMAKLGGSLRFRGKLVEARPWLEQALALRVQTFGDTHPETIESIDSMGNLLMRESRHVDAIAQIERALSLARRVYGDDHIRTAYIAANLGNALVGAGRFAQAEQVEREALAVFRKRLGDGHPRTAYMTENLANAVFYQARYDEALQLYQASIELIRQILGEAHAEYGFSLSNLCGVYLEMERYADAVETCHRANDVLQAAVGPGHFVVVTNLWKLGTALTSLSQFDAADATLRLAHETARSGLPENHESNAHISSARGWLMLARNRPREAEPFFRAGLKIIAANLPEGGPVVASKQAGLGVALTRLKRYQEAETLLLESYATLLKGLGEVHKEVRTTRKYLDDLYTAWDRPDKAALYRGPPGQTTSSR